MENENSKVSDFYVTLNGVSTGIFGGNYLLAKVILIKIKTRVGEHFPLRTLQLAT